MDSESNEARVTPAGAGESHINTRATRLPNFTRTANDFRFRAALDRFRRQKMADLYGRDFVEELNAGAIMSDEVLERIADCAACHKILSAEDLKQQAGKWRRVDEYASEVIALIQEYFPRPQLMTLAPQTLRPNHNHDAGNGGTEKVYHCSICGGQGHTKRSKDCPAKMQAKENEQPKSLPENIIQTQVTTNNASADLGEAPQPQTQQPQTIIESLLSTPSYRQNSRVMNLESIAAMIIARREDTTSTRDHLRPDLQH